MRAVRLANPKSITISDTDDHGASFAPAKDIQSVKPRGYGWIAPSFSGTQLKSGRLAVCADHIVGQWTACKHDTCLTSSSQFCAVSAAVGMAAAPITHTISSVITSDDHGASWQWQPAGSPDGAEMNECAVATLPNNTLVLNA